MTSRTVKVVPRETPKQRQSVRPTDPVLMAYLDIKDQLDVLATRHISLAKVVSTMDAKLDRLLKHLESQ